MQQPIARALLSAAEYTLIQGDALTILELAAPGGQFDAVITDPPYLIASPTKFAKHGDKPPTSFDIDWDRQGNYKWIAPALAMLLPGGAFLTFCDTKAVTTVWQAILAGGGKPLQCAYWIKANPPPQPRKNFCSAVEAIVFARVPGPVRCWNGGGYAPNYCKVPIVGGKAKNGHPTQKPVALMQWLVDLVTDPGMAILDPFTGSSSTGVAALTHGCHFTGIDNDAGSIALSEARLATLPAG